MFVKRSEPQFTYANYNRTVMVNAWHFVPLEWRDTTLFFYNMLNKLFHISRVSVTSFWEKMLSVERLWTQKCFLAPIKYGKVTLTDNQLSRSDAFPNPK